MITGSSVPHPIRLKAKGEEIVRAGKKFPGNANPLVPGSSPGGPTIPERAGLRGYLRRVTFLATALTPVSTSAAAIAAAAAGDCFHSS